MYYYTLQVADVLQAMRWCSNHFSTLIAHASNVAVREATITNSIILQQEKLHFINRDTLNSRNISMNPLHNITGNLTGLLPNLSILDVSGIVDWKPKKQILQKRNIQLIIGLTLSKYCNNCLIHRNKTLNRIIRSLRKVRIVQTHDICYLRVSIHKRSNIHRWSNL